MKKLDFKWLVNIVLGVTWIIILVYALLARIMVMTDFVQCILLFIISIGVMYLNCVITLYISTSLGNFKRTNTFYNMGIAIFIIGAIYNLCELFRSDFNTDIIVAHTAISGGSIGTCLFINFSYQKLKNKWLKDKRD